MIKKSAKNNLVSYSQAVGHRIITEDGTRSVVEGTDTSITLTTRDIIEVPSDVLPADCTPEQTADVLAGMVLAGDVSAEEMDALLSAYPAWREGVEIKDVDGGMEYDGVVYPIFRLRHDGKLYQVHKPHTTQGDWPPGAGTDSLYSVIAPEGVIDEWEQRYGHNPYMAGDKVTFEGHIYEARYDNTTHSPAQWPDGWIDLGLI